MDISEANLLSIGFEHFDGFNFDKETGFIKHNVIVGKINGLYRIFIAADYTLLKKYACEAMNVNTIGDLKKLCEFIKPDRSSLKGKR